MVGQRYSISGEWTQLKLSRYPHRYGRDTFLVFAKSVLLRWHIKNSAAKKRLIILSIIIVRWLPAWPNSFGVAMAHLWRR
jgi:hypothetical protein